MIHKRIRIKILIFSILSISSITQCIKTRYKFATVVTLLASTPLASVMKTTHELNIKEESRNIDEKIKMAKNCIDIFEKTKKSLENNALVVKYSDGTELQFPATYAKFYSDILQDKGIKELMKFVQKYYSEQYPSRADHVKMLIEQTHLNQEFFDQQKESKISLTKENFSQHFLHYETLKTNVIAPLIKKLEMRYKFNKLKLTIYQSWIGAPFATIRFLPAAILPTLGLLFSTLLAKIGS